MESNKRSRDEFVTEFLPLLFSSAYVDLPNPKSNYIFFRSGEWIICDENSTEFEPILPMPRRWKISDIEILLDFAYSVYDDQFEFCGQTPGERSIPVNDPGWFESPLTNAEIMKSVVEGSDWVWFNPYLGFLISQDGVVVCSVEIREDRGAVFNVVEPRYLPVFIHGGEIIKELLRLYYSVSDELGVISSEKMIKDFENKYNMTTKQFLEQYLNGGNPDTFDFNLWSALRK